MEKVFITGTVGKDPEMKYFESGKCKTTFSVAVNRWDFKEKKSVTDWYNIEIWDKDAEFAGEHVKKGKIVTVDGYLESREYQEKTYLTVKANKIGFASANAIITGTASSVEKRFTPDNKAIRTFFLSTEKIKIRCTLMKDLEVIEDSKITVSGNLSLKDYLPELFVTDVV
jgi:single-strand DNA-binding protein